MSYEITTGTAFPYSAITYIEVTFPDGYRARASGVIVGPNDVLTAMHVVYEASHRGWATAVAVAPGADTSPTSRPYGTYTDWGRLDGRTANWDTNGDNLLYDSEAQWDLAVIGMRSAIGDKTGWMQTQSLPFDFSGTMLGYPASGTGLMAQPVDADASGTYGVYDIASDLGAGASGGPLVYSSGDATYVAGILSSGSATDSTYAALFGAGTSDWLARAIAGNDDLIAGLPSAAIIGSASSDSLSGDSLANTISALDGNDRIRGGNGNDAIDGGRGIDTAVFSGPGTGYTVIVGAANVTVTDHTAGRDGTDTLTSIERLAFSDMGLALDLSGNAGIAAKTLGAVFGSPMVGNASVAGIAIGLLDGGMDYTALVQLALDARLGAHAANADVVNLLVTNLTGLPPSESVLSSLTGMLDTGAITQASLGVAAANNALNTANIGLVGLAATGLAFLPFA